MTRVFTPKVNRAERLHPCQWRVTFRQDGIMRYGAGESALAFGVALREAFCSLTGGEQV
jgi:hypothetical protein